ncbi:OX-2 membrane glycoprotein-like [Gymnodraco acuticeps]|uniref:OX-2 membrane glycoprotein-like n=1 Tax=Gymnodraco acuticeps TaxID=8218 RepID=A0A6P8U788_GYMAC|nr:OX-2 membrane glycoprotein-like [Gymnodraco acuticeps]XP_034072672.1 OX-2 membrane glycoprotein-like [Gymnodraco acuticeps]XP_034072673.1 OX-2 membrane glycoprotein-like [Gymnodraco acuticeps]XP_034072674.1 OX-2 membrane glycoprotein-like [Gymnodraco acuticeps]XP_034072675.1 OX-2 membrane glycoprotein-like [Gymnodraco acuticeps]
MCGPALLCVLLWISGLAVSRTQGQVVAPASVTAEAGLPLLLGCSVTTETGDTVRQVRWLDRHKKVLLAYEQSEPVRVSHQEPNVQLNASHSNGSYITIQRVGSEDEGCYSCIFDVFPRGPQEGATCVSVTGKVSLQGNRTALNGRPVTLSCAYSLPEKVHQVLWRKTAEQGDTSTVASYTKRGHHNIEEHYRRRFSLSRTLDDTQLTIQAVSMQDEACYTCEFHAYPDGTKSGSACLSIYVLPNPEVSHVTSSSGVSEANCTARSRPPAEITWDIPGENRTLGPPVSSAYDQGDGTTVVTSTLLLQSAIKDLSVTCVVQHPGLEKPIRVSLPTDVGSANVVLLSMCGVAAVVLLCLCVCVCKCFMCNDE